MSEVTGFMCILPRPVSCSDRTDLSDPESVIPDLHHCIGEISAASQKFSHYNFFFSWHGFMKEYSITIQTAEVDGKQILLYGNLDCGIHLFLRYGCCALGRLTPGIMFIILVYGVGISFNHPVSLYSPSYLKSKFYKSSHSCLLGLL